MRTLIAIAALVACSGAWADVTKLLCISDESELNNKPIRPLKFSVSIYEKGGDTIVDGFDDPEIVGVRDTDYFFPKEPEPDPGKIFTIDRYDLHFVYLGQLGGSGSIDFSHEGQCEIFREPKI